MFGARLSGAARLCRARRARPPARGLSGAARGADVGRLRAGGEQRRRRATALDRTRSRIRASRARSAASSNCRKATVMPRFCLFDLPPEETPGARLLCLRPPDPGTDAPPGMARPPERRGQGCGAVHVLSRTRRRCCRPMTGCSDSRGHDDRRGRLRSGRSAPHPVFDPRTISDDAPRIAISTDFPAPGIAAIELATADRELTADYLAQWEAVRRNARRQRRRPRGGGERHRPVLFVIARRPSRLRYAKHLRMKSFLKCRH